MSDAETQATPGAAAGGETETLDHFQQLLQKEFRPRADDVEDLSQAVRTFAEQALGRDKTTLPSQAVNAIRKMIADIDTLMGAQINEILHHPDFQKLEGAWRGLQYLCKNTETSTDLKIRVMNISKKELGEELDKYSGVDWDQSPIFRKVYEQGYGVLNGDPYACLVGDYHFDHSKPDVDLLAAMAKISASAHAPFITGVSQNLFGLDDWSELSNLRDLSEICARPTHIAWNALRRQDDSRYLGLAAPRFMARQPYGEQNPVDAFHFEEDTGGADSAKFCWANSAYAMATNITRSYKLYGWCARIRGVESGGLVQNLPTHVFQTEKGSYDQQIPTEVSITDRREAEMAKLGLMPLVYSQNSNEAAFIGAQSLHEPPEFEDNPVGNYATSNARLGARLPYVFACSRFAHFLKHMVRNKVGSFMERADMEKWLNSWIKNYVESSPDASDIQKAKKPLKAAQVTVSEDPENPGMYDAKFFLRPHYQLEGANISLRLVSKLPSEVGA